MNRYLVSLIVALLLYISAIAGVLYVLNKPTYCPHKCKNHHTRAISFCIVSHHKSVKTTPKKPKVTATKPKHKPKHKTKPTIKPTIKPKPKPKPKPKIVKPIETPKKVEKVVQKKEIVKEEEKKIEKREEEKPQQEQSPQLNQSKLVQKHIESQLLLAKQNKFLAELVERINSNKSYPHTARRRGIEGKVKIQFIVLEDGNVGKIKILSGRSIFHRSAKEAIERSFPIEIDKTIFDFPKEFKITISYILRR